MPSFFDAVDEFKVLFAKFLRKKGKGKKLAKDKYIKRMKLLLSPFILRRLKSEATIHGI